MLYLAITLILDILFIVCLFAVVLMQMHKMQKEMRNLVERKELEQFQVTQPPQAGPETKPAVPPATIRPQIAYSIGCSAQEPFRQWFENPTATGELPIPHEITTGKMRLPELQRRLEERSRSQHG